MTNIAGGSSPSAGQTALNVELVDAMRTSLLAVFVAVALSAAPAGAATIGGAISYLGYMLMWGGGSSDEDGQSANPLAGLLILILGPIAAGLIQAAISRSREYNADTEGGAIAGDPMHLASALEKLHLHSKRIPVTTNPAYNSMFIVEPLNAFGGSVANLFSTHPPLEKRLQNLIGREATGMFRYAV